MQPIPLTKGMQAFVDDEDYEKVAKLKWHASKSKKRWYARAPISGTRRSVYMHRFIMDASSTEMVDHRNGDSLMNVRTNLRRCSNRQNSFNQRPRGGSSRFKGVHWSRKQKVWVASIHVNYGCKFLGHFRAEEDAARRYDAAAIEAFGEFARTNFQQARAKAHN